MPESLQLVRGQFRRYLRVVLKASGIRILRVRLRHRGLTSEDAALAGYPRSGSTWMRFVIFSLVMSDDADFDRVNAWIPYVGQHHRARRILPRGGRLVKTHEPSAQLYHRAVYLVRDPRDVVISEHRYQRMAGLTTLEFEPFSRDFIDGRVHGLGTWSEHVSKWLDHADESDAIAVVKYEDLKRNPTEEVIRIAQHLGLPDSRETVSSALVRNSIERMQAQERNSKLRKADESLRHVGTGISGGWRGRLSPGLVREIEYRWAGTMERCGYGSE